jgi:hypothetical protein
MDCKGIVDMTGLGTTIVFDFVVLPLILPLIIGLVIIFVFNREELDRMAGLFVFKPVIAYPIWFFGPLAWLQQETTGVRALDSVLLLLPGLVLPIIIVYPFRHLFSKHRLVWLFLMGDILRWGNTWLVFGFGEDMGNPFVSSLLWVGLVYPSVYSIVVLIILLVHRRLSSRHAAAGI